MIFFVILAIFMIFLLILYVLSPMISPEHMKLSGKHVLVTGGSSGIGKAIAAEVARRGCNVTLLARNQHRLSEAKVYVEQFMDKNKQKVICVSVDLAKDYSAVEKAVSQAREKLGPVDMLVNCAGTSTAGSFEDLPISEFQRLVNINYLGTVYATRSVIGDLKRSTNGRVVLISSQAGQLGLYGFTAYSASKFALKGFAEALQMELRPFHVRVCLAFPPDTDTPGYVQENLTKPKETRLLSETAGLFQPEYVAKCIVNDSVVGKFNSYIGMDGYMLGNLTCGMSPVISIMEGVQQVILLGIFRCISFFYLDSFDRTILKCKDDFDSREPINKSNSFASSANSNEESSNDDIASANQNNSNGVLSNGVVTSAK